MKGSIMSRRKVSQIADTDTNPMNTDDHDVAGAILQSRKLINGPANNSGLAHSANTNPPSDGNDAAGAGPQSPKPVNGSSSISGLAHPGRFRISQNYADHVQTKKKAVVVPMRRPDDQDWVFVPPGKEWRDSVGMLKDKANREYYVVEPELLPEISETLIPVLLVTYVTRGGSPGLWPIRLPNEAGRLDSYNRSALEIVNGYAGEWIRVTLDESGRCYQVVEMASKVEMPQPKWPEGGFAYLFGVAIKANIITSLEHPLLKTLRGEL
jgi:hypothetical protein